MLTARQKQCVMAITADEKGEFYYNEKLDGIWGKVSQEAAERFIRDFTGESSHKNENAEFWDDIKHFNRSEFRCKCGKYCDGFPVEPNEKLVKMLDQIREHFNSPVTVTSGVRCKTHNTNVDGASSSQHLNGTAADIKVKGKSPKEVAEYCETLLPNHGGIGIYKSWVHVDVRSSKARWNG